MAALRIDRGEARDFLLEALGHDDHPYVPNTNPSPFQSSDTLAAVGWAGDLSPTLMAPAVAWVDATLAQYLISFAAADTANLESGPYSLRVTFTRAGRTGT